MKRKEIKMAKEIKFEIVKELGVIGEGTNDWKKELNLISWNDGEPKYDIRAWSENHEKMGKGVVLTKDEIKKLKSLIKLK